MIPLNWYLILSSTLFTIGLVGLLSEKTLLSCLCVLRLCLMP